VKALRLALTAARLAAPVVPRDETSTPRRDGSTFDYPSDSTLQAVAHGLIAHGLLLEFGGWTLGDTTVTCAWTLTHIESGEGQTHVLEWPLFTDMPQRAHATAAAISHCWRHLVMQLLGLRVEPRDRPGPRPVAAPALPTPPEIAALGPDDLPKELGGQGIPTPRRDAPAELLHVLVDQWARIEAEHDAALGHPVQSRGIADAWARCRGGLKAPRMPAAAEDFAELAGWLRGQMR